jgi:hypothetical protein
MIQQYKTYFASLVAFMFAMFGTAQAAVPTEITEMTTDATTVFTAVSGVLVTIVGFMILLGIVKKVRAS